LDKKGIIVIESPERDENYKIEDMALTDTKLGLYNSQDSKALLLF
jgi:hypothetical protein